MQSEALFSPSSVVERVRNPGWRVTFAGTGINLALGVLYTWSLFKGAIEKQFGWQGSQLNDPYALCCMAWACKAPRARV